MYKLRIVYNDGTCAVWSNIINIHIDTDGIYFTRPHEPKTHFVSWRENFKNIKVVKKNESR